MHQRTLYDVLMVSPYADHEFITSAYRILAKRHHPDLDASAGASARMAELNEAHAILSDPDKRARYDEIVKASTEPRPSASAPGAVNLRYSDGVWAVRSTADRPPQPSAYGEAGPPPAMVPAKGTVLGFGRYKGWAISQIRRYDPDYLAWLARTPAGRTYQKELEAALRQPI
jgi:curved DNA-binding protein CbpA